MNTTHTREPSGDVAARPAAAALAALRRHGGRWGLIVALAALPVYYGVTT